MADAAWTNVEALAELLLESKSVSVALTADELVICPGVDGVTTIVTMALEPFAKVPTLQFTGPVPLQFPWLALAELNVTPVGNVSDTVMLVAVAGPLLTTTNRYERACPCCAGFGDAVFVRDRSILVALTTFSVAGVVCNVPTDSALISNT